MPSPLLRAVAGSITLGACVFCVGILAARSAGGGGGGGEYADTGARVSASVPPSPASRPSVAVSRATGELAGSVTTSDPFGWLLDPPAETRSQATPAQDFPRECMPFKAAGPPREFHFTRGIYSSGGRGGFWGGRGRGSWCIDHPKAEEQFLGVLDRLTGIDAHHYGNAIALDDPDLRRFPILYMLEVGRMAMTEEEVEGLRSYLLAGGMLIIDDFWGNREWFNWEMEIRRVLPEYPIEELTMDHEVYRSYYQVDTILQVPAFRRGWTDYSDTSEQGGIHARNFGIFDENRRLLVAINWNTDLGDAWEWMEQPTYPLRFSTYAYQMGVNYVIYGMSY